MVIAKKLVEKEEYTDKIKYLLGTLDIIPSDLSLYILAFVHRSIVNEKPHIVNEHNERLEFLGDAILELIVTEQLFRDFPEKNEGELTDIRSALVRGRNLAEVARKLHFDLYLVLGNGEEMSGGRKNEYLLANSLEAFIGALYLDLGMEETRRIVLDYIYKALSEIIENNLFKDFKSLVQEYAQAEFDITPTYQVLSDTGPDHDKIFEVGVFLGEKCIGVGKGSSKKKAQESAAEEAYSKKDMW